MRIVTLDHEMNMLRQGSSIDLVCVQGNSENSCTWSSKQPVLNVCFNWMIPNCYMKNGCFTKHPFETGCLGFQVIIAVVQTTPTRSVTSNHIQSTWEIIGGTADE